MNPELSDTIDAYLKGELKGEALHNFEHLLKTNDALASEVEIFRLEKQGHERLIELDLRRKLIQWQERPLPENGNFLTTVWEREAFRRSNNRWLLAAVLMGVVGYALVFTGLYYFKNSPQPIDNQQINPIQQTPQQTLPNNSDKQIPIVETTPQSNPQKDPSVKTTKNEATTPKLENKNNDALLAYNAYEKPTFSSEILRNEGKNADALDQIIQAWNTGNFEQVINRAQSFDKNNAAYNRVEELLAHTHFQLQHIAEAENIFSRIAQTDTGDTGEDAAWYQSLCLIILKKRMEAIGILATIKADKTHRKNGQAQKLFSALLIEK